MAKEWKPYVLSPEGRAFVLDGEGNVPYIYDDKNSKRVYRWSDVRGYPTIGMGVKIEQTDRPRFEKWLGKIVPPDELAAINEEKVQEYVGVLNKRLEELKFPSADDDVYLSDGAFYVLFSYMWNTGPYSRPFKRLLPIMKTGDVQAIADHIRKGPITQDGVVVRGLVTRRNMEADEILKHPILERRPTALIASPGRALAVLWVTAAATAAVGFLIRAVRKAREARMTHGLP